MHLLPLTLSLFAARALAGCAFARDGAESPHGDVIKRDIPSDLVPRDQTRTLIGDLQYNITTPVGRSIANIILGSESGQSDVMGTIPKGNKACKADACCVWYNISMDLTNLFQANAGCGDLARQVIRAGFHDAASWSLITKVKTTKPKATTSKNSDCKATAPSPAGTTTVTTTGGGADGSLILSGVEINRTENIGLEDVPGALMPIYQKYAKNKVSMADLIQYAANHATVTCTQGPRIRTFVGRKDSKKANTEGLLPEVSDSPEYLVSLFANKTIVSDDLISLVGAHSTGKQFHVNASTAGWPFDQTPGIWDVFFYPQMQTPAPPDGIFRLDSDVALSKSALTSARWTTLANGGQAAWNAAYAMAYVRLSLLGVNNINNLTECTQVLPRSATD